MYGKALANGYPIAALGGRAELMRYFVHPDPSKRVLLAGTYNGHRVPTAAAIATLERLHMNDGEIYGRVESLGQGIERHFSQVFAEFGVTATIARQGSAFCVYYMDHAPEDWHDIAAGHDFQFDERIRRELIEAGVYVFPLATKQWPISAAHTPEDIDATAAAVRQALECRLEVVR